MTDQHLQPLRHALRDVGNELRNTEPPAALRERVLLAVAAAAAAANGTAVAVSATTSALVQQPVRRFNFVGAGAMAIGLAAVVVGAVWWSTMGSSEAARLVSGPPASPFVALVSEQRLRQLAREPLDQGLPWVVATELPRERLAVFGLPFDPARAGESVRAELLMHPAGEVLAVRIVR